jgi:hypothetical protein
MFELTFCKFNVAEHIIGAPRPLDPQWVQDNVAELTSQRNEVEAIDLKLIYTRPELMSDRGLLSAGHAPDNRANN